LNAPLFVALCAAAVAGLLYGESKNSAPLRWIFKPAAAAAFILAGLAAGATDTVFGQAILAGLVLCALGDILLIPRKPATFLGGMAAFAAGHCAYVAAFAIGGLALSPAVLVAGLAALMLSGGLLVWLWKDLGEFRIPVVGYAVVISAMMIASVAHWVAAPTQQSALLVLAAYGFALSDVSVARDQFRKREFANRVWGLPLYFGAQCLFALNV
jgi:uncharacterized membrane protein YhhN